ncbi:ABC transporter [bacterium endosymbiont of Escarpia laminata]|nr:MAG: ABC transporter [bacterium endosymbiont of Escarpia laminata]
MAVQMMNRVVIGLLLPLIVLGLSACASVPEGTEHNADPLEGMNRSINRFNTDFDNTIAKPVAKGYQAITPDPLDRGFTNFFHNLADINSAANNLFQLKPGRAITDVGRLCVNTTVGLLGFIDVASDIGIPEYKEDLGQTLGYWGYEESTYIMLPMLGPSTVRDFIGKTGDVFMNPIYYTSEGIYWTLLVFRYVDLRADLLRASKVVEEAAIDPYAFVRESYLQKRRFDIYDGDPPMEDDMFFDDI